ncbi:MAG: hypothetical protein Q9174_002522 [Haloplaca sp. 1 TL-2023]
MAQSLVSYSDINRLAQRGASIRPHVGQCKLIADPQERYQALLEIGETLPKISAEGERLVAEFMEYMDEPSAGWSYVVKPSLPISSCPENLVLLVKRPKAGTSDVHTVARRIKILHRKVRVAEKARAHRSGKRENETKSTDIQTLPGTRQDYIKTITISLRHDSGFDNLIVEPYSKARDIETANLGDTQRFLLDFYKTGADESVLVARTNGELSYFAFQCDPVHAHTEGLLVDDPHLPTELRPLFEDLYRCFNIQETPLGGESSEDNWGIDDESQQERFRKLPATQAPTCRCRNPIIYFTIIQDNISI